jgi:Tfp pilus assembly protein PilO
MKKLSKRDKKVLIIGGGIAAVILIVFYVALPFYESMSETEGDVETTSQLLARSIQTIQSEQVYRQQEVELQRELARLYDQLLDAEDPGLAQNQLENLVRGLAEEHGLTITRSTPLQQETVGERYAKITLQLNVQGEMADLASFLHALSVHPKFIQVENFNMNSFRVRDTVRLQPRMNVYGYIRLSAS